MVASLTLTRTLRSWPDTTALPYVRCERGAILLKYIQGLREIPFRPWQHLRLQSVLVVVLVDLDALWDEDKGCLLAAGGEAHPHHAAGRLLCPEHQLLLYRHLLNVPVKKHSRVLCIVGNLHREDPFICEKHGRECSSTDPLEEHLCPGHPLGPGLVAEKLPLLQAVAAHLEVIMDHPLHSGRAHVALTRRLFDIPPRVPDHRWRMPQLRSPCQWEHVG